MGVTRRADRFPAARVLRQGAQPPPGWRTRALRRRLDAMFEPLKPGLETAGMYVAGLFPLVAVVLLGGALLWIAGLRGSP